MADTRSFDDRDGWIWMDGKLVPWREANVHILTHALHYGSGVFEGEQGGISETVGWQGGGGFTFYRLGEAVFDADDVGDHSRTSRAAASRAARTAGPNTTTSRHGATAT